MNLAFFFLSQSLLSTKSAKQQETTRVSDEILELLSKPSAKVRCSQPIKTATLDSVAVCRVELQRLPSFTGVVAG